MIRKILVAGLFLGGGYYLIKKLLPTFDKKSESLETEVFDYDVKKYPTSTGGGGGITEINVRNTQPFAVLTQAGVGNDPSWDFDPYSDRKQGGFIKDANMFIL